MNEIADFIKRAADKTGFTRDLYNDQNVPTHHSNIMVLPFFGDLRSTLPLSSLVLKRYKEIIKGSKYLILASWPGCKSLFPYVDEYWSISDKSIMSRLYESSNGFENTGELATLYHRNLNLFFEDVIKPEELGKFYSCGITNDFWETFKNVERVLPNVPSSSIVGIDFTKELMSRPGFKVFIYPSRWVSTWSCGKNYHNKVTKDFWVALVEKLLNSGVSPVVYLSPLTHDISVDFAEKCLYVSDPDISKVLGVMRGTGCVLDIFSGISRLAIMARCPFVSCEERSKYFGLKEYELDDLCGYGLPKQYIFSFSTIIREGNVDIWNTSLFESIVKKFNSFLPTLDRDKWPPTTESITKVPYSIVRKKEMKKIGAKFIKVRRHDA
jgi:hypothetical protein